MAQIAAVVQVPSLVRELPHVTGVAKKKKDQKKREPEINIATLIKRKKKKEVEQDGREGRQGAHLLPKAQKIKRKSWSSCCGAVEIQLGTIRFRV